MNEWISVKDRLPEIDEFILVYCGNSIAVCIFTLPRLGESCFMLCDDINNLRSLFNVTHWMPLPELPKDGK